MQETQDMEYNIDDAWNNFSKDNKLYNFDKAMFKSGSNGPVEYCHNP